MNECATKNDQEGSWAILGGRAKALNFKKYEQIDSSLAKIANKKFYSFKGMVRRGDITPRLGPKYFQFRISIPKQMAIEMALERGTALLVVMKTEEQIDPQLITCNSLLYSSGTWYFSIPNEPSEKMLLVKGEKLLVYLKKATEEEIQEYENK